MGLFNAVSTVSDINRLLKDFENQTFIIRSQMQECASPMTLKNSLNVLKSIHQQLINKFCSSSAARVAMFTIFGNKLQMDGVLTCTKGIIYDINAIID